MEVGEALAASRNRKQLIRARQYGFRKKMLENLVGEVDRGNVKHNGIS